MSSCGTCGYSWSHLAGANVSCGAPVDDDALRGGEGVNPVWAERKYGRKRILLVMLGGEAADPPGSIPESMSPDDGLACKMWRAKAASGV